MSINAVSSSSGAFSNSTLSVSSGSGGSVESLQQQIQSLQAELVSLTSDSETASSEETQDEIEKIEKQIENLQKQLVKAKAAESSSSASSSEEASGAQPPPPPVEANISEEADKLSKFQDAVSTLTDEQKEELGSLLEEAKSAMESGDLDADKLLEGVSDGLKSAMEDAGVNLKETLNDLNKDYTMGKEMASVDYASSIGANAEPSNGAPKPGGLADILLGVVG